MPVYVYRAGPAVADAATEFGTRQSQMIAQYPKQGRVLVATEAMLLPVDIDLKFFHGPDFDRQARKARIGREKDGRPAFSDSAN